MTAVAAYPPGPKINRVKRFARIFRFDPLASFMNMANYGDISHTKIANVDLYLFNDPELIRDVLITNNKNFTKTQVLRNTKWLLGEGLLTSEGDFHTRQRRLAAPAFHHQRIASYARTMVERIVRAGSRWQPGQTVNMAQEMMRLTLGIAGKALFDAEVEEEAGEVYEALTSAMELFSRNGSPIGPLLDRLPLPSNARAKEGLARLDAIIYRIIAEHKVNRGHNDLLSMLIAAQDEEGDRTGMTDKQLRDESMTIFLAGHETTALALSWAWYLLAQNPEAEAEMHRELDQVLCGRLPAFADIPNLKYTRMVLAETMRLYPPAYTIAREAVNEYRVRDYVIPPRSNIIMSQYVMHRNPRFYPDPERFDPLRFTPEAEAARPKFAYFPFGGGPRVCIGEPFAWTEGILALAALGQFWQPRLVPGQRIEPQPLITLRPKGGITMILEKRNPVVVRD